MRSNRVHVHRSRRRSFTRLIVTDLLPVFLSLVASAGWGSYCSFSGCHSFVLQRTWFQRQHTHLAQARETLLLERTAATAGATATTRTTTRPTTSTTTSMTKSPSPSRKKVAAGQEQEQGQLQEQGRRPPGQQTQGQKSVETKRAASTTTTTHQRRPDIPYTPMPMSPLSTISSIPLNKKNIKKSPSQGQSQAQAQALTQRLQIKIVAPQQQQDHERAVLRQQQSQGATSSSLSSGLQITENKTFTTKRRQLQEKPPGNKDKTYTNDPTSSSSVRRLYSRNSAVPDSMNIFCAEIHREDRISRSEEIELGTKTQEAVRLHAIHEQLKKTLQRDPTDEEWCAASGKINMAALAQAIDDGLSAKNKLVTSNLRMVQSVVNTYLRNGLAAHYNAGDMMQDGVMALIRAAEMFQPDRGFKFSTYAMYWVRASVKTSQVSQSRIIAVPQRIHVDAKRMRKFQSTLYHALGRMPTNQELALAVGETEKFVDRCLAATSLKAVSMDHGVTNRKRGLVAEPNEDDSFSSLIADLDTENPEQLMLRQDMLRCLRQHLRPDELLLILLRFGLFGQSPTTIAELSQMVGEAPYQVRRRISRTIQILQDACVEEEWRSFAQDMGY